MNAEAVFFQVTAAGALLLLVRHSWRTAGPRDTILFFGYLFLASIERECLVVAISAWKGLPLAYSPAEGMATIGGVGVAVVAGWVFAIYVSFQLALLIQRRCLPGTNIFLTIALAALVTSAISYCVEITGMRAGLWDWQPGEQLHAWFPFGYPEAAVEGWPATTLTALMVWCGLRYGLFSPVRWRSVVISLGLVVVYRSSEFPGSALGIQSTREKMTILYSVVAVLLGFVAPRRMLGTSDELLRRRTTAR